MCIGTDLSVSKNFQKDDDLSPYIIHASIFRANCLFYHSLYHCETSILKGCKKQLNGRLYQNSCKVIFSREYLHFDMLFLKYCLSVC